MYLRHTTIREERQDAQLLASGALGAIAAGEVVQETVAAVWGSWTRRPRGRRRAPWRHHGRCGGGSQRTSVRSRDDAAMRMPVSLEKVRLERVRVVRGRCGWDGCCWRALEARRADASASLPAGRESGAVAGHCLRSWSWRDCAEPSSELHIAEDWYRTTRARRISSDVPAELVNEDRLYRALDRLLPRKERDRGTPEGAPGRVVRPGLRLGAVRRDFARISRGKAAANPLAQRGYSARSPARLQAGLHRPGGDAGRHAAWLRGLRRQSHRT